jgi:hypothetical protein
LRALLLIFALVISACSTPTGVQLMRRSAPSDFGPWSTNEAAPAVASTTHGGSAAINRGPNDGLVDFVFAGYSRYLTKIDGARCEHRPTCSHYALLVMKRHGYLVGSMMTIDRLICGNRSSVLRELDLYKIEDGQRYYYDPVENNDFFF